MVRSVFIYCYWQTMPSASLLGYVHTLYTSTVEHSSGGLMSTMGVSNGIGGGIFCTTCVDHSMWVRISIYNLQAELKKNWNIVAGSIFWTEMSKPWPLLFWCNKPLLERRRKGNQHLSLLTILVTLSRSQYFHSSYWPPKEPWLHCHCPLQALPPLELACPGVPASQNNHHF